MRRPAEPRQSECRHRRPAPARHDLRRRLRLDQALGQARLYSRAKGPLLPMSWMVFSYSVRVSFLSGASATGSGSQLSGGGGPSSVPPHAAIQRKRGAMRVIATPRLHQCRSRDFRIPYLNQITFFLRSENPRTLSMNLAS